MMAFAVVVVVFQKEMLVYAVDDEGPRSDSYPGECALESIPPGELAGIPPRLAVI